jgi:hypothetical protein
MAVLYVWTVAGAHEHSQYLAAKNKNIVVRTLKHRKFQTQVP